LENSKIMPLLFLGHGSPMNAIEDNQFTEGWRQTGENIPLPKAIICISAHWETKGTYFTAMQQPRTIHDFGGFPQQLYAVRYPAPGNPALAEEAKNMMKKTDAGLDNTWGLDHGCWSVISHLYPDADVPVIQMSLDYQLTPRQHYDIAKELAALRRKGILFVGSGNMVHNLQQIAWGKLSAPEYGYDWAISANEKMKKFILDDNHQQLMNYRSQGDEFERAIPTPEHFLPLLYILALKEENENVSIFNDKLVAGSLSMTSVKIG